MYTILITVKTPKGESITMTYYLWTSCQRTSTLPANINRENIKNMPRPKLQWKKERKLLVGSLTWLPEVQAGLRGGSC